MYLRVILSSILVLFLLSCNLFKKEKKVVFIIVDGISYDMLKKTPTPTLDELAKQGNLSEAYVGGEKGGYSQTPTISAVGYNSLLTGVWANKHNVFENNIISPNYSYPTIYRLFKNQYPNRKTAIFSSWLDNRTKLVGEGLPQTKKITIDYAFDGFEIDTVRFPHDDERQYIKNIDELVANEAARYIQKEGPYLSWVYLEFSDDMGHKFGDSPQLYKTITFEDALIGKIKKAIENRMQQHTNEDWLLIVTTDHGRTAENGKHHGGQSPRERSTWIAINTPNTNEYFEKQTPSIVDILPTMTSFLELEVPKDIRYEWDGVSLINPIDAIGLKGILKDNQIHLNWQSLNKDKKAKIYISTTNEKKNNNSKDNYTLVDKVSIGQEKFVITLDTKHISDFYKIVLEMDNGTLNTWIINKVRVKYHFN